MDNAGMEARKLVQCVIDYAVYVGVRVFICIVQSLRLETCRSVAGAMAVLAWKIFRLRRTVIEDNLLHAFPDFSPVRREQIARQMWEHLFLMIAEIAHASRRLHRSNWRQWIEIREIEKLVPFLLADRPKVIVAGHYGNFELSGYVMGMFGFPSFTVARTLDNLYLDRYLNQFRGMTGQYMLPKKGSSVDVSHVLETGGTLCVLGDQAAGRKGCWVQFFGRPASTHKSIALFSMANEAPVAVAFARRTSGALRYEIGFSDMVDPLDLPRNMSDLFGLTQWYSDELESIVREAPEQYWWVHRRWKGEPPRSARKAA